MNYQGTYGAGNLLLIFVDGKAYYRPYDSADVETAFQLVQGLQLNASVEFIYAELIPASTVNFKRAKAVADGLEQEYTVITDPIAGSPAAAFVTDGINQSVLIFPDGTWRATKTYLQWTTTDREYVPIGTIPQYINGVLYLVGKDLQGRLTRLYRSVSGRPIDFMIQVTATGDKAHPSDEETYGAPSVAERVSFDEITAVNRIKATDGSFFVSTRRASWLLVPNYETLIFSEPKYRHQFLFSTGTLNQFSTVDILSDTALIDGRGVATFDAISALKFEGKNSNFSQKIFRFLTDLEQTITATFNFDNYALFALQTIHGAGILVYDILLQKFVSLDIYPGVGLIKQFAEVKVRGLHKLFFITVDGLYHMYGSDTTATCRYYFGELSTGDNKMEQRGKFLFVLLDQIKEAGTLQVSPFVDRKRIASKALVVTQLMEPLDDAVQSIPYNNQLTDTGQIFPFNFEESPFGSRLGFMVEWNCDAMLSLIQCSPEDTRQITTQQREASIRKALVDDGTTTKPLILCVTGNDGVSTPSRLAVVKAIKSEDPAYVLGAGNHNYPLGASTTRESHLEDFWDYFIRNNKALFALGNVDLDTLNGQAAIQYYLYAYRYFNVVLQAGLAEVFVINSGINSAGSTVEPDGITSTSIQALWLRDALARSTATWKIVIGHKACDWPLKTWGASFYLNAANNYYERIVVSDFNTFTIGLGGYALGDLPSTPTTGSIKRYNSDFGYLRIELNKFNAKIEMKNANGTKQDSIILHQ